MLYAMDDTGLPVVRFIRSQSATAQQTG